MNIPKLFLTFVCGRGEVIVKVMCATMYAGSLQSRGNNRVGGKNIPLVIELLANESNID
jgi:hypothetical protein